MGSSISAPPVSPATTAVPGITTLATIAELQTGSDNAKIVTAADILGALGFSKSYTSGARSITAASTTTLAHGLGRAPKIVQVFLTCTTSEGGYTAGDVVAVSIEATQSSNSTSQGISCVVDATNITYRYFNSNWYIVHKTTGAPFNITTGNWTMSIFAVG